MALFTLKNLCLKALEARALKYKFFIKVGFWMFISFLKAQVFWEGHPNLLSNGKTKKKISTNLCRLFKIYVLYQTTIKLLSECFYIQTVQKISFRNNRCFDFLQKIKSICISICRAFVKIPEPKISYIPWLCSKVFHHRRQMPLQLQLEQFPRWYSRPSCLSTRVDTDYRLFTIK
jgi:hypothetical protein